MIAVLASIRPDSWNFPLFLHVAGAAIFFGAVTVGAVTQLTAAKVAEPDRLRRVAFRTLLIVGLPAYIIFRVGAEWLYEKEFSHVDEDPVWVGIGYIVSDLGALVFLISLILAGIAVRKPKGWLSKTSGVLSVILLIGLVVAVWAMGAKPD
jgi:amino acid transporter